jgi:hypothetical protein
MMLGQVKGQIVKYLKVYLTLFDRFLTKLV